MTKKVKQEQVKVTLPPELYAKVVAKCIEELGEVNLSQFFRNLARRATSW